MTNEKYSVDLWGSHPNSGNDDCWTGKDFATKAEALRFFENPWRDADIASYCKPESIAFIAISGPNGFEGLRANRAFRKDRVVDDSDWRREHAMQMGMMSGVDAYNDAMGY